MSSDRNSQKMGSQSNEPVIPDKIPVILLSGCNLFPHGLLPLYIFEPRYRAMLEHALNHDRMFSVGTLKPPLLDDQDEEADYNIFEYTTLGLIRACVGQEDGTSNLVLQGMKRVRITGWAQREPFRIAEIEALNTTPSDPAVTETLRSQVLELSERLLDSATGPASTLGEYLDSLTDAETLADVVAYNFIKDPNDRQHLLGETDVNVRLQAILEHFAKT